MTLSDFYAGVAEYNKANPAQRHGQALFNYLWSVRPDLSEQIRSTELDPFYEDKRLPETYEWLMDNWDD